MSITRSVPTDDDGTGTTGTIWDAAYLASAVYDKVDALVGDWTAVTFSAGNFTASSGSWTVASGDVAQNRYQIVNKRMHWRCILTTTTVSATPTTLRIAIPTGTFQSLVDYNRVVFMSDNGTVRDCLCVPGDSTHLYISRIDGSPFSAATDTTSVYINASFELA